MAIQIKNDNVLLGNINDLQTQITTLANLAGGGASNLLTTNKTLIGGINELNNKVWPIANGGTGATNVSDVLNNLGISWTKNMPSCFYKIQQSFSIAYLSNNTWYDNNVWWRVFEATNHIEYYSYWWIWLIIVNFNYSHHPPSCSFFQISPQYQSTNGAITAAAKDSSASITGIRLGRDSSYNWYLDLKLKTNNYTIYAIGDGFKPCSSFASKVSNSGFSYIKTWGEA